MHISCTYSGSVQDLKYCYRHFQYFIPDNGPCNEIEGGGTSYESREPKTSIWGENMDSKPQNQIQAV